MSEPTEHSAGAKSSRQASGPPSGRPGDTAAGQHRNTAGGQGPARTRARSSPRRAPAPGERQRDAERSRERILAAATEEFGAHGFAGARVAAIAARAGVNQQLISYYFGGKQGLYEALQQSWLARESSIAGPSLPIEQVIAGYFDANIEEPHGARILVWQALGDVPGGAATETQRAEDARAVEDLRRRQREGELSGDFEPEFIMLVTFAAAMAPITLPGVIRGAYGVEPGSAEFRARFLPQLQRLFQP